ncbi:hypothetical protein AN639_10520 [Candidatus Epulonipiscium fishelsonii]|uniref:Uncharacterized protein n=1 Tax=Candidatus Epulonipiscium fishelsonii TaxID=77094 RepID=A0ACC8XBE9_9FIRM|nr:hypothetical protein AN396_07020 [Epulopiscium sp. SCG-B11WGA-EpuloA1]ONI43445.1 hypothetical protein AN639_10520 [Epulopiscium sp. SCG-B05WGA-EpuloA1]
MMKSKKFINIMLISTMVLSIFTGCASESEPVASTSEQKKDTPEQLQSDKEATSSSQETYDSVQTADVIVVGAGGGGMSAALAAVENGAESVIIIEKMPMTGGSLNTTSGTMSGAMTIIQEIDGLTEDSIESYKNDIITEGEKLGGYANEPLVDYYVNNADDMINYLWEAGLNDNQYTVDAEGRKSVFAPEHTLYSYPRSYKAKPHNPKEYKSAAHELLDELIAEEDKITVLLNTEVVELQANENGQVLNAIATSGDKTTLFTANNGIIMATGGYAGNPKLMGEFSEYGDVVITGGLATADGNGLRLMQEVGGSLHLESMGWIPTYPMGLESLEVAGTGQIATTKTQYAGGILVNTNGERFVNETDADNVAREVALEHQPEGIQYEIYTDKIGEDLVASGQGGFLTYYFQSPSFAGHVTTASSLEELAQKLEIPVDTFLKTVEDYNSHVDAKTTDEFGRNFAEISSPFNVAINKIEGDKFYAVAIKPLAIITMGGIQVNTDMQVVDEAGNAIPGLYAAGETVGGVWGRYVSSGTGVMGPIVFGDLAGENVMTTELATDYTVKPASNILAEELFIKENSATVSELSLVGVKDGDYTVTVDGQEGPMDIKVSFKDETITGVEIVSHNETITIAKPALDTVPQAIVDNNSIDVEAVTGATLTTNRIVKAVKEAAELAKQ